MTSRALENLTLNDSPPIRVCLLFENEPYSTGLAPSELWPNSIDTLQRDVNNPLIDLRQWE